METTGPQQVGLPAPWSQWAGLREELVHVGQSSSVAASRRTVTFKGHNQQEATSLLSSFLVPPCSARPLSRDGSQTS